MADRTRFYIVDVFGFEKYTGNQLAVFLDGGRFDSETMQRIAREINFSETTFVLSAVPMDGGYPTRIFTPGEEVDFAGHPTLGTAYVIRRHLLGKDIPSLTLNLKAGRIQVTFPEEGSDDEVLWMRQNEPGFGAVVPAENVVEAVGLHMQDLDGGRPVQTVSTGLPFLIVPLKSMDALRRASTDPKTCAHVTQAADAKGILVFCSGGYRTGQTLGVRVFVPEVGIPEDPATGSGNGCLAGYLVKHRYFGAASVDIRVGQGYEIGRPSELRLRAEEAAGGIDVRVGGRVCPIAEGIWY